MSNISQHIKEHIERECPIDVPTLRLIYPDKANDNRFILKLSRENMQRQRYALRGAEIALERQWIKYEDGLPNNVGDYICYGYSKNKYYYTFVAHFNKHGVFTNKGSKKITHWQPLPTPPNE